VVESTPASRHRQVYKNTDFNLRILETEGQSGARRLHQIDSVTLGEKISQVHEILHVSGEKVGRKRMANAGIRVRIGLARQTIEFIDRRQRVSPSTTPASRSNSYRTNIAQQKCDDVRILAACICR
jgi:hypothetical protein